MKKSRDVYKGNLKKLLKFLKEQELKPKKEKDKNDDGIIRKSS